MKVSIITINYNNINGLEKTIESVINQTHNDIEYLIIDGGSNDGSVEIIKQYAEKINYYVSEKDGGIYNAMNKGINKATGDYFLFINSGDSLIDSNILTEIMSENRVEDLIYGNLLLFDAEKQWTWNLPDKLTFRDFYNSTIPHPGTFIKRELFNKVGLYDETLKIVSDWKFFLLALTKYSASYVHINKIITKYSYDGISSREENFRKIDAERYEVLRREFNFMLDDYLELEKLSSEMKKIKNFLKIRKFFKSLFNK
ncbi:glycosyltransferase family 2 protein [Pedobacter psychrodurus]|uniref:glycosyltransferase family 2 protein n=1 Tax=Pedobacter psychrodurus TaxID=2530456 RepID=UPI00292F9CAC|nr:glycosyltransferase family 2 protein [Pedobacter psychrodurus]